MAAKVKPPSYEYYDIEDLCLYAGIDTEATLGMLAVLMPLLQRRPRYHRVQAGEVISEYAPSIWSELLQVKTAALQFTCDLKITGMQYDIGANEDMLERMKIDMEATKKRIDDAVGMDVPLSGNAFHTFLYRTMGFRSVIQTKTGGEATSGDALKALHKEYGHEWLLDIKRFIDVRSMRNNFIEGYVEKFVKRDSRIHCDYNLQGTSSHRISSTNPNMLNMPRGYHGYNIRDLYTATEGYTLIAFDFSSCEVKILAALSGDPNMVHACEQGYDFHTFSASMIHDIDYHDFKAVLDDEDHPDYKKYKGWRQDAKAVTFGILYGSSVGGIAAGLGISVQEAQVIIANYFDRFPKVQEFIADCHKMAQLNHFMVTPFGQRKQEHGARPLYKGTAVYNAASRNAQNVSIQSPASTFGLICFAKLNEALKERGIGRCVLTVYDSVEFEVKKGYEAEAIEMAYYYLDDWPVEEFDWLNFKVGCDGEVGPTFGTLAEVHRGVTQAEVDNILVRLDEKMEEAANDVDYEVQTWVDQLNNAA